MSISTLSDFDSFEALDLYLLSHTNHIIHQVWFTLSSTSKKLYKQTQRYRSSWMIKNPHWLHVIWDEGMSLSLIRHIYPQHLEMYTSYPYKIQQIDALRYFALYRYGGFYADMDVQCIRSLDEIVYDYPKDIYLVESANDFSRFNLDDTRLKVDVYVSNMFMYSKANHPFWPILFIELEKAKDQPWYYGQHLCVMYSTGPGFLTRLYIRYMYSLRVYTYPTQYFNPKGLDTTLEYIPKGIYIYHHGHGSWENSDSKILIFLYTNYKVVLFILLTFGILFLIRHLLVHKIKDTSYLTP